MATVNTPQLDAIFGSPGASQIINMTVADASVNCSGNVMYRLLSSAPCFVKVDGAALTDGTTPYLLENTPYFFVLSNAACVLHAIVTAAVVSGILYVTPMTGRPVTP